MIPGELFSSSMLMLLLMKYFLGMVGWDVLLAHVSYFNGANVDVTETLKLTWRN